MSTSRILLIFTRTPLHVGAGASVGAIDQPIQRERHTGFPIIPASSLKGTFADAWNDESETGANGRRLRTKDAAWLFGSDDDQNPFAGALQFSEARLLAFPIRSAKGSFAWITCPLMLQRAVRDGLLPKDAVEALKETADHEAYADDPGKLVIEHQLVLEEYTFMAKSSTKLGVVADALAKLVPNDPLWAEVANRLVVLSNGMMSHFALNACEVAQHVRINDETGTADDGGLFNQENVPTDTLFYSALGAQPERRSKGAEGNPRTAADALDTFGRKLSNRVFQFGADASTGLGFCTVAIKTP